MVDAVIESTDAGYIIYTLTVTCEYQSPASLIPFSLLPPTFPVPKLWNVLLRLSSLEMLQCSLVRVLVSILEYEHTEDMMDGT